MQSWDTLFYGRIPTKEKAQFVELESTTQNNLNPYFVI